MMLTFIFTGAAVLLPGFLTDSLPAMPKMPDYRFYEWGILLIAFFGLIAVLVANTRLTAIVSLGIQGFAVALIFMMFARRICPSPSSWWRRCRSLSLLWS